MPNGLAALMPGLMVRRRSQNKEKMTDTHRSMRYRCRPAYAGAASGPVSVSVAAISRSKLARRAVALGRRPGVGSMGLLVALCWKSRNFSAPRARIEA